MHVTNLSFDCYSIQLVRVGFLGLKEDKICNLWNVFAISKLMYLPCLNWYLDLNWRLLSRRKIKMGKLGLWPMWSASPGWQPSHKSCMQHRNRHHPHRSREWESLRNDALSSKVDSQPPRHCQGSHKTHLENSHKHKHILRGETLRHKQNTSGDTQTQTQTHQETLGHKHKHI